jgi:hypothetical protein
VRPSPYTLRPAADDWSSFPIVTPAPTVAAPPARAAATSSTDPWADFPVVTPAPAVTAPQALAAADEWAEFPVIEQAASAAAAPPVAEPAPTNGLDALAAPDDAFNRERRVWRSSTACRTLPASPT